MNPSFVAGKCGSNFMTYVAHPSVASRAGAVCFSAAMHIALGLALILNLHNANLRSGAKSGDEGRVMMVEFLDLPDGGSPGDGEEMRKAGSAIEIAALEGIGAAPADTHMPPAVEFGAPRHGQEGDSEAEGMTGLAVAREGAPKLSGAEVQEYRAILLRHIERYRRYPADARLGGHEGIVRVRFVMSAEGEVKEAWVELSSGWTPLDDEALAAVQRARPLPSPPQGWPQSFGVSLPIAFNLQ